MEEIKSGKELCDEFFNHLLEREDIDTEVANLVKELYEKNQLTTDRIRKGLKALRQEGQNEQENKD
jgi:hypothetical protein